MMSKKLFLIPLLFFYAQVVSAQVVINEVQLLPTAGRFLELRNLGNSDVDITGWYIQRKTSSGSSFSSLVTSTELNQKIIKAKDYFLISRVQLGNSDVVVGDMTLTEGNTIRVRDSKGKDVDQIEWSNVPENQSYQRMENGEWFIKTPSPRLINIDAASGGATPLVSGDTQALMGGVLPSAQNSFPVEPQIFADAGPARLVVSAGASVIFSGRVIGLKKEPIENARMLWSFGDGATAEGASVAHIFYYPGEYTVVLDAASGFYSASDRISITAVTPNVIARGGGDITRSFVAIENHGSEELDLSFWQIESDGKKFIIPKNTFVPAKKMLTLASEITGLNSPEGEFVVLNFPNGTRVARIQEVGATPSLGKSFPVSDIPVLRTVLSAKENSRSKENSETQEASALNAIPIESKEEERVLGWYIALSFLGAFALLGVRAIQQKREAMVLSADNFEIIEENEEFDKNEPH